MTNCIIALMVLLFYIAIARDCLNLISWAIEGFKEMHASCQFIDHLLLCFPILIYKCGSTRTGYQRCAYICQSPWSRLLSTSYDAWSGWNLFCNWTQIKRQTYHWTSTFSSCVFEYIYIYTYMDVYVLLSLSPPPFAHRRIAKLDCLFVLS